MLRRRSVQWQQLHTPERSAVPSFLDEVIKHIGAGRTYNLANSPNCFPFIFRPPPVNPAGWISEVVDSVNVSSRPLALNLVAGPDVRLRGDEQSFGHK